jgi:hypothetical protein
MPPMPLHLTQNQVFEYTYRNAYFLSLTRAMTENLPPRGVCSHALARVAIRPDVIFEVLRSIPSLAPSTDTESEETANDTDIS